MFTVLNRGKLLFLCILLSFWPAALASSEDLEPWEAEDVPSREASFSQRVVAPAGLFSYALDAFLDAYQRSQSDKTVHRCAFYTSCSAFLPEALEAYGFPIGVFAFLDRYLYRENKSAYALYPLRRRIDGVFKLDDDAFLYP